MSRTSGTSSAARAAGLVMATPRIASAEPAADRNKASRRSKGDSARMITALDCVGARTDGIKKALLVVAAANATKARVATTRSARNMAVRFNLSGEKGKGKGACV